MTKNLMLRGVVAVAMLTGACGESPSAPTRPSATRIVNLYTCAAREAMVAAYLATSPTLPIITELPSGELVYIDWLERVYHHSGPTCE